jgi:acyl carrier protein
MPPPIRHPVDFTRLAAGMPGMGQARGRIAPTDSTQMNTPAVASPEELELAQLIVATLNLEVAAADIDPQAPLYGEGLGLDSIDILEIALAVSKTYGLQLRADDENNTRIFKSLSSLSEHVQRNRTR